MNEFSDNRRAAPASRAAPGLSTRLARLFIVAALACVLAPAQAAKYREGKHYFLLFEDQPVQTGPRVEVLELFWYHCPHCYAMEPVIDEWLARSKPEFAEFRRLPGVFRKATEFDARVYFAAEQLGLVEQLHADIYQEIHVRGNRFDSLDDLGFLLGRNDVDPEEFERAFQSEAVDEKMAFAERMYEKYEASGVPTIIVDGRYRATASAAGGYEELMDVTDFLVRKAASERGGIQVSR